MADIMSKNQDDEEVIESDKRSDFKPSSPAMKDWKKKYLDKEVKQPVEDHKEEGQSKGKTKLLYKNNSFYHKQISEEEKEKITEEDKKKTTEDNLEKVLASDETLSPNQFHIRMCKILILMALIGSIFALIGYILAPESCSSHEDTDFESLGITIFVLSVVGVPINIIIWLISHFNSDVDSGQIFVWTLLHTGAIILCAVLFGEYITQDMFCGCWGFPGEDCS